MDLFTTYKEAYGGRAEGAYKELVKPFIKTTIALRLFAFNLYVYFAVWVVVIMIHIVFGAIN